MKNLFFLLSLVVLFSCGPKTSSVQYDDGKSLGLTAEEVTYSQIKSDILKPHCISCHADVSTETGLKKWITAGDPDHSKFFTEVENGNMPKNAIPLSTKDLQLIRDYIGHMKTTASTPTNTPTPTPNPTPTPTPAPNRISYAEVKTRILTPYGCTSCHSVGTEAKLAKWMNTTTPEKSTFYTYTKNGSMPQGNSRVTAEDEAFILKYVQGYAGK